MRPGTLLTSFLLACTGCAAVPPPEPVVTQATMTASPSDPACRDYTAQAIIGGSPQTLVGHACRQADGSWRVTGGFPGQAQQIVGVYPDAPYLVSPYDPWFWGPPIGLSIGAFVFVDHGRGRHFHDFGHVRGFAFNGIHHEGFHRPDTGHSGFHHRG
ncbi:MAG: hypothetical protein QOD88_1078 [Mycobacterium sp.]|nr:hypothetical protein [Mycobacterium sp.]